MFGSIQIVSKLPSIAAYDHIAIIGRAQQLEAEPVSSLLPAELAPLWPSLIAQTKAGDEASSNSTWFFGEEKPHKLTLGVLPEACSHHNSPARPHGISELIRGIGGERVLVILALEAAEMARASVAALARACPRYSQGQSQTDEAMDVFVMGPQGEVIDGDSLSVLIHAVRRAAYLVDQPPNELSTTRFVTAAREAAARVGAGVEVIEGIALKAQGFGGLWNVGKAAAYPPALVVLKHEPSGASQSTALVGKGIVYDTGGLSIKTKTGMPGMKVDMAGAAAILYAFEALVEHGYPERLYALLCLAENSVGALAMRPDDVITMYSGKRVEVNNTDAEGRLVLADGVAYAAKHLEPSLIIDMATLTGAQLMATGKRHAGLMTNHLVLEQALVEAGRVSGDLVHPLPYAPEFFRAEFRSKVADLKNSVKDRMNAQSSCAGQFIGEHLEGYEQAWAHIDIAGPAVSQERGTAFGVALLLQHLSPAE